MKKILLFYSLFCSFTLLPITFEQIDQVVSNAQADCDQMPWWLSVLTGRREECKRKITQEIDIIKSFMKKVELNSQAHSDELLHSWNVGKSMPLDYITKDDLLGLVEAHPTFKSALAKDIEVQRLQFYHKARRINSQQELQILLAQIRLAQSMDEVVQDVRDIVHKEFLQQAPKELVKDILIAMVQNKFNQQNEKK